MAEAIRIDLLEERIEAPAPPEYPMAWHRFLSCFLLCGAAALRLGQAAWLLLGGAYRSRALQSQIYEGLPALKYADWAWAACMAIAAVLLARSARRLVRRLSPNTCVGSINVYGYGNGNAYAYGYG